MKEQAELGGTFPLPETSLSVNRMGYGAMQLAGPQVWGPPHDVEAAIAVRIRLRVLCIFFYLLKQS
jgi:pyridoxine 4-dehydrogenase